ncbi:hypothetical protein Ocin01_04028 [Orchesella cincta]|uniref:Uncharacterized protein n=1 Tax=Orchesella cincta TaxID=48709 RepID=A0A1D2NBN2_ORCCI|nr:hypothetical protein Ocin01_04028 [Orchesella cincta]
MAVHHRLWLKLSLIFLLTQIIHYSNGNVGSGIDNLHADLTSLREELADLTKVVEDLETTVKRNIAGQKLDKAIGYILLNEQEKASMYWADVVKFLEPSLLNQYLKTLIESTYIGNSINFYYVLDFLQRNQLYMGYRLLLQELEHYHEIHSGPEIFAVAHQIKTACGTSNELYSIIPKVVQNILAGPVIFKNVDNMGYIMAGENLTQCNSRETCYGSPRSQVFVYRLRTTKEEIQNEKRALWQFMAPENISELSEGFYMMNKEHDLYFVFKQRPGPAASILRNNITFDSYYARDMHAQFLPTLIPNATPEENFLRIGVRERFRGKVEYFYSAQFKKVDKLDFSRRPMHQNEMNGFVWEVIPVPGENDNNAIESGRVDDNCKFTV